MSGGIEWRRGSAGHFAIVAGAGGKNLTIRIFFPNVARHVALLRVVACVRGADGPFGKLPKWLKEFANPKAPNLPISSGF